VPKSRGPLCLAETMFYYLANTTFLYFECRFEALTDLVLIYFLNHVGNCFSVKVLGECSMPKAWGPLCLAETMFYTLNV
jgi:hypothetical protein